MFSKNLGISTIRRVNIIRKNNILIPFYRKVSYIDISYDHLLL